jgi:hypothetical protein
VPIATLILRLWSARGDLTRRTFRTAMLWIGVGVILPMELVDVWLGHRGGNNAMLRATGGAQLLFDLCCPRAIHLHARAREVRRDVRPMLPAPGRYRHEANGCIAESKGGKVETARLDFSIDARAKAVLVSRRDRVERDVSGRKLGNRVRRLSRLCHYAALLRDDPERD